MAYKPPLYTVNIYAAPRLIRKKKVMVTGACCQWQPRNILMLLAACREVCAIENRVQLRLDRKVLSR
jgi:hypothetical protein